VVDPGWHIGGAEKGAQVTEWLFEPSAPVEPAGTVLEPKLKYKKTPFADDSFMEEWYQDGEITFRVPVKVKPGTAPGEVKIAGKMVGQECSNVCRPLELPFSVSLTVVEGVGQAPPPADDGAQTASQEEFQKRGLIGFLLLAMGGGLVSLLMPCTYPLIPITLTYFLKQGGDSRGRGALLATAYSAGMILSFTALGFILSLVLGEDGPRWLAANPWANIAIGAIFLYFAFSLFGLYEIALPSSITGSVASGPRSGVGGAFVLGLLFSIVTFSCTIPVLGVVLGLAASKAANFRLVGVLAMLVYSLTMALPFFFMGLFPSMLKSVPKSGGWLHTVKVTTAFAELALALAYIAKADVVWGVGALTRPVMVAIWVATLAFMALYLLGVFRLKGDMPPPHLGLGRVLTAMGFGILAIYLGTSSKSAGVFDTVLPPNVEVSEGKGAAKEEPLFLSLGAAMEEAKKTGKPIFVEFTGAT
jgi:thiol:disulfide interchange protein